MKVLNSYERFVIMRVVKEHDERKNEIIDTASRIFGQKGYDKSSVNDILNTTFMQSLNSIIRYASYLYLLYIVVRESSKKTIIMPSVFKYLTRYSFLLIYLGSLFLGQVTGGWLFIRFTGAGELAFMFVMMYFFYRYPRTKGVKLAFAGLTYFILYNIAYITYYNASFIGKVNTITL